jgi:hypothetical protein
VLIYRKPTLRQPQEAGRPNPSLGLVSLILPGISDVDFASGQRLNQSLGTPARTVAAYGRALLCDANQECIYTTTTPSQRLTNAGSIIWAGEVFSGASADASMGGVTHNSANASPYTTLEVKRRDARVYLSFSFNNGASFGEIPVLVFSYTGPIVVVGTFEPGKQRIFVRTATQILTAESSSAGNMGSAATAQIAVGERLNARNPQAACAVLGVANRTWAPDLCMRLLSNPWQLFAPEQIYVPRSAAAPALPTLSLPRAKAGTITATGFVPQWTAS